MKYKKFAFIGMMGCGKTTVSSLFAKKLKLPLYDSDKLFERKFNTTINDFFKNFSEDEFRKNETLILKEIVAKESFILSCGGGMILKEENRDILFNYDICTIYLRTSAKVIYDRIKDDRTRPLLLVDNPKNEIEKILFQREKYYKLANIIIDTDNKTVDEIVNEVYEKNSN